MLDHKLGLIIFFGVDDTDQMITDDSYTLHVHERSNDTISVLSTQGKDTEKVIYITA